MISNDEIWNQEQSPDDSKNFIKIFKDIDEKKKTSTFRKGKKMTKKPQHLIVNFNLNRLIRILLTHFTKKKTIMRTLTRKVK
jgi:hypothetical protein